MTRKLQHGKSQGPTYPQGLTRGIFLLVAILFSWTSTGCSKDEHSLTMEQLDPGEQLYITRIVTLERAKAVALVERKEGLALLDSLNIAWGDSAMYETLAGIPTNPLRAKLVNNLLGQILLAEEDSLLRAPRPDRLQAPLPDPVDQD